MKKIITIILMLIVKCAIGSCGWTEFRIAEYLDYDAIFTGEVISIDTNITNTIWTVNLKPLKIFRGIKKDTISIKVSWAFGNGVNFEKHKKWLVTAYLKDGKLFTNCCTRTENIGSYYYHDYLNKCIEFQKVNTKYIKEFSKDGALLFEGEIINKQKNGKWTFYYNDTISKTEYFDNGKKVGTWKEWGKSYQIEKFYSNNSLEYILNTYFDKKYKTKIDLINDSIQYFDLNDKEFLLKHND